MGAWGTSPFSSDQFGDDFAAWVRKSGIQKAVEHALTEALAKARRGTGARDTDDKWVAIGMVIWAFNAALLADPERFVRPAEELLREIEEDEEWLGRWRSKAAINRTMAKVENYLRDARSGYTHPIIIGELEKMFDSKGKREW